MRNSVRNGSPWVRKPEPTISTPSSRSGRSRSPSASRRTGSWVGSDICSTGMSASGYMIRSGTQAPWSRPAAGVLVDRLGAGIIAAIRCASAVAAGVS